MSRGAINARPTTSDLQREPLIVFKEELENMGWAVIPKEYLPWSMQELNQIEKMTSPKTIPYKRAEYGDTGERNPVSYFRILHPTNHETCLPECMELIDNNSVKSFFLNITELKNYDIDRCQAHMYSKGDFISVHTDSHSCPEYLYSVMISLSEDYKGGEFVIHASGSLVPLKPEKYSMVIAKSHYPHEVKEIISGVRRSLVFFIKP